MSLLRSLSLLVPLLWCGVAVAQNMKPPGMSQSEAAARRYPQPVRVGDLIGRTVLQPLESQPILGRVDHPVKRPDGATDVVIRYGGFLGLGTRPIAVPLDAMVVLGEFMEVVDFTPAQLDRFPTDAEPEAMTLQPEQIIKVGLARPSH